MKLGVPLATPTTPTTPTGPLPREGPSSPLTFRPLPQDRVWGGAQLRTLFGKDFPADRRIGESWEVADRPDAVSVVTSGPWAGRTLRELMAAYPVALVGVSGRPDGRFPWLAKVLDAREDLSLQVHPPARLAAEMGGEPKTELWYLAAAKPGARLLAGIRPGVTPDEFAARSRDGSVIECFHSLPVQAGDALFVPSGRVHALGAGTVIFELQQNSDTTYRVFDFNRPGLDGRPRPLHLAEALRAIDFTDHTPALVGGRVTGCQPGYQRALVRDPLFSVTEIHAAAGDSGPDLRPAGTPSLLAVVSGALEVSGGGDTVRLRAGDFILLPAGQTSTGITAVTGSIWLQMTTGQLPHSTTGLDRCD